MSFSDRLPRLKRRTDDDLGPALDRLKFKSLTHEDGVLNLEIVEEQDDETSVRIIESMAVALAKHLGDAENYVETVFRAPRLSRERFLFRVERAGASTPHELRREAEARAERLEWTLRQVRGHVALLSSLPGMQEAMGVDASAVASTSAQVVEGIQSLLDGDPCGHCSTAEKVDSK